MGLFERLVALQKTQKKGLYHRLKEYREKYINQPKSFFLKAKKLRDELEDSIKSDVNDELQIPKFDFPMESPKELDPAISLQTQATEIDPFEDWQKEAIQELEKKPKLDKEELKQKILEDEEDILTLPDDIHVASQRRIDYYLSIFDSIEEFDDIEEFIELLESIAFFIQEQLGTRSILVLSNENVEQLNELHYILNIGYQEVNISIDKNDGLLKELKNVSPSEILYISKLKKLFDEKKLETNLFNQNTIEKDFSLILPIKDAEQIYAIFLLSNPLEQKDYVLDDLEFLRVLKRIAIFKIKQLKKQLQLKEQFQKYKDFNEISYKIFQFIVELSSKKTLDEVYDEILNFLENQFSVTMFSFVIIEPNKSHYKIFAGKNLTYTTIQKFQLDINSDLVGLISNLTTIHEIQNFKDYKEIIQNYSEEDLSIMERFIIVPLVHLNWLVGFIIIHKQLRALKQEEQEYLLYFATLLSPFVTNLIIKEERELLFKDTFSPFKKRLELEIKKAEQNQTTFSIIDLKIKNLKRLITVNSIQVIDNFLKDLIDTINSTLYQHDYLVRMGHGRLIVILSGRSKEEGNIYLKKLMNKIKEIPFYQDSPVQPNFTSSVYSYPYDADNLKKLLAIIDA